MAAGSLAGVSADPGRQEPAAAIAAPVLEAARRVISEVGWHAATLERIAAAAGISRVTLHRRGITKATILAELTREGTERYRAAMWPALTAEGSGAERLALALDALCAAAETEMPVVQALDQAATEEVFHEVDGSLTRDAFSLPLERLLRDGAADGSLAPSPDPAETATVLFNLVGWTYLHLRSGHGWPAERATRALVDVALDGVAA